MGSAEPHTTPLGRTGKEGNRFLADQVCKLATPGARKAMEGVRRRGREEEGSAGRRVEEACVMNWLMRGGGHEWGMEFLEAAMSVRAYVLGEDR